MLGICVPYFDYFGNPRRIANLNTVCEQITPYPHIVSIFADYTPAADCLIHSHGATVWQKERLINLGFSNLRARGCDKVMYMDADCVFQPDWYAKIDAALDIAEVVQCFSNGTYNYEDTVIHQPSAMELWRRFGAFNGSWAGGAWGFNVAALGSSQPYLYEHCLVGGGDTAFLAAVLGQEYTFFRSTEHQKHYITWAQKAKWNKYSVNVVQQEATFLPCGNLKRRHYATRHNVLKNYSPLDDTFIYPGVLIQMPNKDLELRILDYLRDRE
jgi:hypothetical protein